MRSLSLAGVLALSAGACSSDPAPVLLDASPTPDADNLTRCLVPADYGALGAKPGIPDLTTPNSLTVVLDPGPPRDDFFVNLIPGKGAFAGGALKTGTFTISGADASFTDCGLCTNLIADIDPVKGPAKFYYPVSGTVTLTSATASSSTGPSMIAGSAQDLRFVEIDFTTGMPVMGGCVSTIASISFSP